MPPVVALKIDVDTDRGTREGVPALVSLLEEFAAPACFLFSLGPDNTGKAIRRVFRPGFFQKVSRTSVVQVYGVRTLLNGTLLPAPHIGRRHGDVMRRVRDRGFETGIHCYDHFRWQDYLFRLSLDEVRAEFGRAREEYHRIFGEEARTAGAPGWQANATSRQVYDEAGLLYASDTRGRSPFFPSISAAGLGIRYWPTCSTGSAVRRLVPMSACLLTRPGVACTRSTVSARLRRRQSAWRYDSAEG